MNLKFLPVLAILLLSGFVSAGSYYNPNDGVYYYKEQISKTYYDSEENSALTRTIYVNYNNDERYSTYDYRHGYSYRNSEKYWENNHNYVDYDGGDVIVIGGMNNNRMMRGRYYDNKDNDYRYNHMNRYNYDYDYNNRYDNGFFRMNNDYGDWRHVKYLDSYEFRDCYDYPPRGKLFYVRCE